MPAVRALPLLLALLLLAACGGASKRSSDERTPLVVAVNAPFSRTPYLGRAIEDGARLAAREVNANGIRVGGKTYDLKVETLDSGLSPARAVSNLRRAVGRHAVAIGASRWSTPRRGRTSSASPPPTTGWRSGLPST
jgi:ABC-type branched-subunit amino acid transport system substrate-binding protein